MISLISKISILCLACANAHRASNCQQIDILENAFTPAMEHELSPDHYQDFIVADEPISNYIYQADDTVSSSGNTDSESANGSDSSSARTDAASSSNSSPSSGSTGSASATNNSSPSESTSVSSVNDTSTINDILNSLEMQVDSKNKIIVIGKYIQKNITKGITFGSGENSVIPAPVPVGKVAVKALLGSGMLVNGNTGELRITSRTPFHTRPKNFYYRGILQAQGFPLEKNFKSTDLMVIGNITGILSKIPAFGSYNSRVTIPSSSGLTSTNLTYSDIVPGLRLLADAASTGNSQSLNAAISSAILGLLNEETQITQFISLFNSLMVRYRYQMYNQIAKGSAQISNSTQLQNKMATLLSSMKANSKIDLFGNDVLFFIYSAEAFPILFQSSLLNTFLASTNNTRPIITVIDTITSLIINRKNTLIQIFKIYKLYYNLDRLNISEVIIRFATAFFVVSSLFFLPLCCCYTDCLDTLLNTDYDYFPECDTNIEWSDITTALSDTPNNKAPGSDGIPSE
ncbi:hypothetical protein AYI68_g6038, partial [Smittium mucronatum]